MIDKIYPPKQMVLRPSTSFQCSSDQLLQAQNGPAESYENLQEQAPYKKQQSELGTIHKKWLLVKQKSSYLFM